MNDISDDDGKNSDIKEPFLDRYHLLAQRLSDQEIHTKALQDQHTKQIALLTSEIEHLKSKYSSLEKDVYQLKLTSAIIKQFQCATDGFSWDMDTSAVHRDYKYFKQTNKETDSENVNRETALSLEGGNDRNKACHEREFTKESPKFYCDWPGVNLRLQLRFTKYGGVYVFVYLVEGIFDTNLEWPLNTGKITVTMVSTAFNSTETEEHLASFDWHFANKPVEGSLKSCQHFSLPYYAELCCFSIKTKDFHRMAESGKRTRILCSFRKET